MRARPLLALSGLWAAGLLIALWVRPLWPVDETRYLAVAWEMWQRGDFLVPYLNGAPYSHKPPLLFWLMHLGWSLFGVNEWWPRLVPPLFALANLFLIARLACRLWPERADIAVLAPWIAFGGLLWTVFSTVVLFDMLMVFFALTGMLGLVEAWRGNALRGWALLAVAIGLGVLAKGPVILLHTLPAALLAPWWAQGRTGESRPRTKRAGDDLTGEGSRGDLVGDEPDEARCPLREGLRERVGTIPERGDGVVHPPTRVLSDPRSGLVVDDVRDRGDRDAGDLRDIPHRDARRVRALPCSAHPLVAPLSRPWIIALLRTRKTSSNGVTETQTAAKVAVQSVLPIAPM